MNPHSSVNLLKQVFKQWNTHLDKQTIGIWVIKEQNLQNLICVPCMCKGGVVVRALASHQCGAGSNLGVDAICGLSLLLVLYLAPRGFSPDSPVFPSPQKPTFPNSNSTRNGRRRTTMSMCYLQMVI